MPFFLLRFSSDDFFLTSSQIWILLSRKTIPSHRGPIAALLNKRPTQNFTNNHPAALQTAIFLDLYVWLLNLCSVDVKS